MQRILGWELPKDRLKVFLGDQTASTYWLVLANAETKWNPKCFVSAGNLEIVKDQLVAIYAKLPREQFRWEQRVETKWLDFCHTRRGCNVTESFCCLVTSQVVRTSQHPGVHNPCWSGEFATLSTLSSRSSPTPLGAQAGADGLEEVKPVSSPDLWGISTFCFQLWMGFPFRLHKEWWSSTLQGSTCTTCASWEQIQNFL